MTRSRLAATAALSLMVLPFTAVGGVAPGDNVEAQARCKTLHTDKLDFEKTTVEVVEHRRGPARRAGSAAVVPVKGAKVITKLKDLTTEDGSNNVVDRKDTDRTNDNGIAKTKHEFNSFGNYRLRAIVKIDGVVVATDTVKFGVFDRESGKCDPPQQT